MVVTANSYPIRYSVDRANYYFVTEFVEDNIVLIVFFAIEEI